MVKVLSEEKANPLGEQTFDAEDFDLSCQTLADVLSFGIAKNF